MSWRAQDGALEDDGTTVWSELVVFVVAVARVECLVLLVPSTCTFGIEGNKHTFEQVRNSTISA